MIAPPRLSHVEPQFKSAQDVAVMTDAGTSSAAPASTYRHTALMHRADSAITFALRRGSGGRVS